MNLKTPLLIFITLLSLSGCGGTYHAYYETIKIALEEPQNASMNLEEVQSSTIDVMSVTRGERPTAIMALAYLENGQHKWVSGDDAMLIMENGRIVRTIGLGHDLIYTANRSEDPLKQLPGELSNRAWDFSLDWNNDEYGYPVTSQLDDPQVTQLNILTKQLDTLLYTEKLRYEAPSNYVRTQHEWNNYYWFEKSTGTLIKSKQTLSPLSEPIEMIYLSRIARLDL